MMYGSTALNESEQYDCARPACCGPCLPPPSVPCRCARWSARCARGCAHRAWPTSRRAYWWSLASSSRAVAPAATCAGSTSTAPRTATSCACRSGAGRPLVLPAASSCLDQRQRDAALAEAPHTYTASSFADHSATHACMLPTAALPAGPGTARCCRSGYRASRCGRTWSSSLQRHSRRWARPLAARDWCPLQPPAGRVRVTACGCWGCAGGTPPARWPPPPPSPQILQQLGARPDLIIGNYSDGNLVASLLSRALGVTQCNIAHALEKTKYPDADVRWAELDPQYHFGCQVGAGAAAAGRWLALLVLWAQLSCSRRVPSRPLAGRW
jgi:hypothetical protein